MKKIIIIFFFGMLIVACKQEKSLETYMIDSWQTTYLKLEMPTYEKSDSLYVFEDKFDKDPALIAQSIYHKDGTFEAWFINKEGDKISESNGNWSAKNDSLFVDFTDNNRNIKVGYHIKKTTEGFLAKSVFDWDNDGAFDDFLTMKTKRIKTN